jgi:hypothetical protein
MSVDQIGCVKARGHCIRKLQVRHGVDEGEEAAKAEGGSPEMTEGTLRAKGRRSLSEDERSKAEHCHEVPGRDDDRFGQNLCGMLDHGRAHDHAEPVDDNVERRREPLCSGPAMITLC